MRKFKLENANGDLIDLTTEKVFFHDPDGLGYSLENTFRRIKDRFALIKSEVSQQTISGSIAFLGETPYEQYTEFIEAVSIGGLKLMYSTKNDVWYYRDVIISELGKSEILQEGYLDISASFLCLTPWYKAIQVKSTNQYHENDWVFGDIWPIKFSAGSSVDIDVDADCTMESPCCLTIYGKVINPIWKHYVNGVFCCNGTATVTINNYYKMTVDNRGSNYSMSLYNDQGDKIQDLYQLSDFGTKRFIWLKKGHNHIEITGSSFEKYMWAELEANLYYDTV